MDITKSETSSSMRPIPDKKWKNQVVSVEAEALSMAKQTSKRIQTQSYRYLSAPDDAITWEYFDIVPQRLFYTTRYGLAITAS